ncbi:O-antigen ligase family protein [Sedimentibacter sp. zth1]|uniref:O-antigen ligase family protein n=1 Tax=Sedimentibacter sp. zth1 TaxID=2816908 RepID=UPI001A9231E0|nr:O-antigen ligase family protein [Sedimentibacter sp. zth1]QSX04772.1 O-antigen ligase family protein [Sedimentibacter sp. zth1]
MKKINTIFLLLIMSVLFAPLAYIFVIVLFIRNIINNKAFGVKNLKQNKVLSVIFFWYIIVTILSQYKLISTFFLLIITICIIIVIYVSKNYNTIDKDKLLKIFYIVSLITYAIGIFQMVNPNVIMPAKWVDLSQYKIDKRMFSTFFNPNVYGFYINLVVLCIVTNMTTNDRPKDIRMLENATLPLSILCLFFTFSRTSWVSLIGSLIIVGIFTDKKYFKYIIIITVFLFIADNISGTGRADISKISSDGSMAYRFELWKTSINIIKDNLFSGIGFGTFFKYTSTYSATITHYIEHCHNIYLQIFMETGLLGFLIFVVSIFKLVVSIYKKFKIDKNNKFNKLISLVLAMTLIHGLVDSVPLTPQIMLILSMIVGVVIGEYSKQLSDNLT